MGSFLVALLLAQSPIFYWVDKQGTVVATDQLAEVPEPYYSMWRARLRELEEERKKRAEALGATPKVAPAVPAPPAELPAAAAPALEAPPQSMADRELARQKQWREEVAKWRTELRVATEELQRARGDLDAAQLNPVLRQLPQQRAPIEAATAAEQQALKRVEAARRMLLQELPARAKKEGVPPRWLE